MIGGCINTTTLYTNPGVTHLQQRGISRGKEKSYQGLSSLSNYVKNYPNLK